MCILCQMRKAGAEKVELGVLPEELFERLRSVDRGLKVAQLDQTIEESLIRKEALLNNWPNSETNRMMQNAAALHGQKLQDWDQQHERVWAQVYSFLGIEKNEEELPFEVDADTRQVFYFAEKISSGQVN